MSMNGRRLQKAKKVRVRPPLFFDSNFATNGVRGVYPDPNPNDLVFGGKTVYAEGTAPTAIDIWLTYDPKRPGRVVACCSSHNLKNNNGYPRASLTTGEVLQKGGEYWTAASWLMTNEISGSDWNALMTAGFGPPYNGPSPTSFADQPNTRVGYNWLRFSRTVANGGINWAGEEVKVGEWTQVIMHYRLDESPNGWIEMWINTGPGPNDFRKVLPMQYVSVSAPGTTGASYTSIGVYGVEAHKLYVGHHQVGAGPNGKLGLYLEDFGPGFDPALLP